jgi:NAD(P)-dependent dehydrogenase (short-subunit alcohol dehydrogenase family)
MKNIVVIGGNRGAGYEVVKACLRNGYQVAVACKESEACFPIQDNDKILVRSFDLRDINKCVQFIDEVVNLWHKVDGVVFYAGITPFSSLTDCTEELYNSIFDINLKSTFFIAQTVLKSMINHGGSFVFFGTSHMESGQIDRAAYAISKGG